MQSEWSEGGGRGRERGKSDFGFFFLLTNTQLEMRTLSKPHSRHWDSPILQRNNLFFLLVVISGSLGSTGGYVGLFGTLLGLRRFGPSYRKYEAYSKLEEPDQSTM